MIGPATLPPMPLQEQLDKMFEDVLRDMDLPVDKIRILRSYDNEKKWKLINDKQQQITKQVTRPSKYLEKLSAFLDKKMLKKALKSKEILTDETSTSVLRHIEISLRTNSVDWVFEFLNSPNNGLGKLVGYMRHLLADCASVPSTSTGYQSISPTYNNNTSLNESPSHNSSADFSSNTTANNSTFNSSFDTTANLLKKGPLTISKGKVAKSTGEEAEDDIHICMMCLRAIMNNKQGFQQVFGDTEAIYCIVRSILHQNLRTKTLVVQMLSSICMVQGGQEIVSEAFDRFEKDFREPKRFWTLMHFIRNPMEFHVEFLSSAVQFFDYFVNNVDDLNFRVHLQYEMTLLGLDKYIEIMGDCESDELQERMISYANSVIDVGQLLEDSNQKTELLEEREVFKMKLSQANERVQEVEAKWITDKAALDKRLSELMKEREKMEKEYVEQKGTWTRTMNEKDRQSREDRKRLEQKISELEAVQKTMQAGLQVQQQQQQQQQAAAAAAATATVPPAATKSPPTPPPPAPGPHKSMSPTPPPIGSIPPPPPIAGLVTSNGGTVPIPPAPPPPMMAGGPPVASPPPPGGFGGGPPAPPPPPPPPGGFAPPSNDVKTIKKIYQTKNKLPQLNWTAMKPNQAKNTVFENLNDELIIEKLDFSSLEEMFKMTPIGLADPKSDQTATMGQVSPGSTNSGGTASARKTTLLDAKRLQNVAITRRKVAMDAKTIMAAVHQLDLSSLSAEKVDILSRILPSDEERKMYEEKSDELYGLSEEDQFLSALCKIERLEHKLAVMRTMAEFDESVALLQPQLTHVTAASKCARDAKDFHGVLEVILAFGNYMNSGKRGGAYGFKLSSLDSLAILKSPTDRTLTLLHMITASIENKLPHLSKFAEQLKFVDKATTVQWDSVNADMKEIETGFRIAENERKLKGNDCPQTLIDFLESRKEKLEQLSDAHRLATKTFAECVEFYGENAQSTAPNVFFQKLSHFIANYAKCRQENEAKAVLEKRQKEEAERRARAAAKAPEQNELMLELVEKVNGPRRQRAKIDSTRMDHGDFEKLMNGLKHTAGSTPNRRKLSKSPSPAPRSAIPPPVAPKSRVLSVERDRQ